MIGKDVAYYRADGMPMDKDRKPLMTDDELKKSLARITIGLEKYTARDAMNDAREFHKVEALDIPDDQNWADNNMYERIEKDPE